MNDLYLILHKVRGEPAFDIAQRFCASEDGPCQEGCGLWNHQTNTCLAKQEEWWIIPTSGHGAYPYWYRKLDVAAHVTLPADWPDHYSANDRQRKQPGSSIDLTELGLESPSDKSTSTPTVPMKRRSFHVPRN